MQGRSCCVGGEAEGCWGYGRMLKIQEDAWATGEGCLGYSRASNTTSAAANPSGLLEHEGAGAGSKGCSGQPRWRRGRSPAHGDAQNAAGWDASGTTAGSDPSFHPSALTTLIFIPIMSNWLGAKARRKPGSAGLQLSRQRSIRDTQQRLILLQHLTAQAPNKALSPDSYLIAFSHSFSLRKWREVAGGESPLSQPLNHAAKEKATRIFSWHCRVKLRDQFERLQKSLSFARCHLG